MQGDFTRLATPRKGYVRVLQQQGRVALDADWNEESAIRERTARDHARDTVGDAAVMAADGPEGYGIIWAGGKLRVRRGRAYVDGILCELPTDTDLAGQPDLPDFAVPTIAPGDRFLAYLDVWQRHVTSLEDPALREVALGGADTTTRLKTVAQVKLLRVDGDPDRAFAKLARQDQPLPRLRTGTRPPPSSNGGLAPPGAGYVGAENRLYRVEVHERGHPFPVPRGAPGAVATPMKNPTPETTTLNVEGELLGRRWAEGQWVDIAVADDPSALARVLKAREVATAAPGTTGSYEIVVDAALKPSGTVTLRRVATVKWSRHNGSLQFGVERLADPTHAQVATLGRDEELGLRPKDWVEVLHDGSELRGEPGPLALVTAVDPQDRLVTVLADVALPPKASVPKLRRWDSEALPARVDQPLDLEDGVLVEFSHVWPEATPGSELRTGDYWAFWARSRTGTVQTLEPEQCPPLGPEHHYAKLALVTWPQAGADGASAPDILDLRTLFWPLAQAWSRRGNRGTTEDDFVGTTDAQPLELRVQGERALRIEPGTTPNLVGGHARNSVQPGAVGAAIGGGGAPDSENRVQAAFGTVAGGAGNLAGCPFGAVGGGQQNAAGNAPEDVHATVAGGYQNLAKSQSSVGGGALNKAQGKAATIAGGSTNTADGETASVGGGYQNGAKGLGATVAGGRGNAAAGDLATVGGGERNAAGTAPAERHATVAGGLQNVAKFQGTVGGGVLNKAQGPAATIAGGSTNTADGETASIGGGYLNAAKGKGSTIAGGRGNAAAGDLGTVGGGEGNAAGTQPTEAHATVAGGAQNTAKGKGSTIAGGRGNAAAGDLGTVGGGEGNAAGTQPTEAHATVAGGAQNTAKGKGATVAGGEGNLAEGVWSMVPGGAANRAAGQGSLAAGSRAKAMHDGAFVWADAQSSDFASTGPNQFLIRAQGGVGIGVPNPGFRLDVGERIRLRGGPGATTAGLWLFQTTAGNDRAFIGMFNDDIMGFWGNTGAGWRLLMHTGSGNLGVRKAPGPNALEVEGQASKAEAGQWLANSDARIKTDVRSIPDALGTLERLRPVQFRYTDAYRARHPGIRDMRYFNVVAQEFQQVFPDYVLAGGEDGLLQVDTHPMLITAVQAVKDLHALVRSQEARIGALESSLAVMQDEVNALRGELEPAHEGEQRAQAIAG
jgi:hypothetical protein